MSTAFKNVLESLPVLLEETKRRYTNFVSEAEHVGINFSNKQSSEHLSAILESVIQKFCPGAVAPKKDSEPDVIVDGIPVEIKTTSGDQWRGGAYSKRPGYYLLLSWEASGCDLNLFCAGLNLKEKDWAGGNTNNYYATSFGKKQLLEKIRNNEVELFMGSVNAYERGKKECIKLERV